MALSFTPVLNASISAGWLVLAVAGIRLVLKKAPKAFHCALWALVAIRLLCPVSFESELSLIPSREVIPERYISMEPVEHDTPATLEVVTNPVYDAPVTIETETTVDRVQNWDLFATILWLTGMGAMGIYAAFSYLSLRLRVRMAGWVSGNVWECDELESPFILGLFRPRIYLPSNLDDGTRAHVLAHERSHLKRLDHLWKPLGFLLLTVHWFNPVMWLGYVLLCRDIELACDERVIRKLDKRAIRAYSEALVLCSVTHRSIAACPLAFGEVGVKGRIKSMLSYKKPGFWVLLAALIVSVVLAVGFLTDPAEASVTIDRIEAQDGFVITDQTPQTHTITIRKDQLPADVLNGSEHTFEENQITVLETQTTRLWLKSARMRGDGLALKFDFSYELTDRGTVILPYAVQDPDHDAYVQALDGSVYDGVKVHTDACHVYTPGRPFELHIDMDVWQYAPEYISFDLRDLYHITYEPGSPDQTAAPSGPALEEILSGSGYTVTANAREQMYLMLYKHWLPEDTFSEGGHSFSSGELNLWESDTCRLATVWAGPDGDALRLDLRFEYTLPEAGTIVLPYRDVVGGREYGLRLGERAVHDYTKSYDSGVTLTQAEGTEAFSLTVDRTLFDNADSYLAFTVDNVYELTYVPADLGIQGRELRVEEVLYSNPEHTVTNTAEYAPIYIVGDDLVLTALEQGSWWDIRRNMGELSPTTLTAQNFDELFLSGSSPDASSLRRENRRAWVCYEQARSHLLLQQNDGTLYLAVLAEQGKLLCDLYRLGVGDPAGQAPQIIARSFALVPEDSFDAPFFHLYSDGTFTLTESMLSSYHGVGRYVLEEDELVLKTGDGKYIWTFHPARNGFTYDAKRSSPIQYMKTARELALVQDGELFRSDVIVTDRSDSLEDVIRDAVIGANWSMEDEDLICVESHEILTELIACGVSQKDSNESPMEYRTVYLLGTYATFKADGMEVVPVDTKVFTAEVTIDIQNGVYTPTQYWQSSEHWSEIQDRIPADIYKTLEDQIQQKQDALLESCLASAKKRCTLPTAWRRTRGSCWIPSAPPPRHPPRRAITLTPTGQNTSCWWRCPRIPWNTASGSSPKEIKWTCGATSWPSPARTSSPAPARTASSRTTPPGRPGSTASPSRPTDI